MSEIFSRLHILSFLAALFFFIAIPAQAMAKIGIVYRGDLQLHQQLAEELSVSIQEDNVSSTVLWELKSDWTEEDQQLFRDEQFAQLIAIGDLALSFCIENSHDVHGIFLLVSSNKFAQQAESSGWQGARIWTPMAEQFAKAREILPNTRSLGVLISPKCQVDKKLLQDTARQFGFTLNLTTVKHRRHLLPSLASIFRQNDAILMLPDPGMMNNVVLAEMLRLQKKHRTPLIAVSKRFVTFGAFMSVDYSLDEMIQKITEKMTHLSPPDTAQPLAECCLVVYINKKVAAQLRIAVPRDSSVRIQFASDNTGGRI